MSDIQTIIDQKVRSIGNTASKNLGGNEKLSRLIEIESKKIFRDKEVLSTNDLVGSLKQKIADELGVEVSDEIEIAAKKVVKEVRQQEKEDPKTVNKFREESLTREIVEGYKKANEGKKITAEQEKTIRDQADLVAKTYYTGEGISSETKDELLTKDLGVEKTKLPLAYTDLEGTVKLLQKTPGQINQLKGSYEAIRNGLSGLNQPTNIRELTSFNSLAGVLKNKGLMADFNLGQSKFLSVVDRIDTFSGGAIRRTMSKWGGELVSKLGTESSKAILENGLKVFAKEGFQTGFKATLQGFLGGGASAAAAGGTGAAAGAGAVATGAAAAGLSATGIGALVVAAGAILKGIKKLGEKIKDGINNLVVDGKGEDEDINKLTKKKWFIPVVILVFLLSGCMLQNNNVSTLVSPTKDEGAEYTGEYGVNVLINNTNEFKVPTCNPDGIINLDQNGLPVNGNNRLILREIALSIKGMVKYSHFSEWHQIGASPKWNTPVPPKYNKVKDENGNTILELDMEHEKKRQEYPYYGLDCGFFTQWVWLQCTGKERFPLDRSGSIYSWMNSINGNRPGVEEVHLESMDDLKIGDVFVRTREESLEGCTKIDKKTGETYEAGCRHAAIYIGNGEVMEEVGNGGDPAITTVASINKDYVTLERDKGRFVYPHVIRITSFFKD